MKLLLDSCTFIWLAGKPAKLSRAAAEAMGDSASELYLSDTSVWEIALKHARGKLRLPEPPRIWIPKQLSFFQIIRVPIEAEALFRSGELPAIHPDPFDRLIAAQALTEPFRFITPDERFRSYGVSCIW